MVEEFGDESFAVHGCTDIPVSNILERGRYKFEVKEIVKHTAKNGNLCVKMVLDIDGRKLTDYLSQEGKMEWKWRQFLFAIGIRNKSQDFTVSAKNIVGKSGLIDVGVKDRVLDDGSTIKENKINSYSPIEQEVAPIKGVEPEPDDKKNAKGIVPETDDKKEGEIVQAEIENDEL